MSAIFTLTPFISLLHLYPLPILPCIHSRPHSLVLYLSGSMFVRWVQQSGNTKSHYSVSFISTWERVEYFGKVVEACHHRVQWGRIFYYTDTHFLNDKITLPQLTLGIKVSSFSSVVNVCFLFVLHF